MVMVHKLFTVAGLGLVFTLTGCSPDEVAAKAGERAKPSAPVVPPMPEAAATTAAVVEVRMVTDGARNYFEPAEVSAKTGDVIRFVLDSGVHNVSFPASSNAGAGKLPVTSPYLQRPGQTYDLVVEPSPGAYTFQCDPHAALGMVGTLKVE